YVVGGAASVARSIRAESRLARIGGAAGERALHCRLERADRGGRTQQYGGRFVREQEVGAARESAGRRERAGAPRGVPGRNSRRRRNVNWLRAAVSFQLSAKTIDQELRADS